MTNPSMSQLFGGICFVTRKSFERAWKSLRGRHLYFAPAVVAFVLMAFTVLGASAQSEVVTEPWSQKAQTATEAFWTREMIALAPALSMPVDMSKAEIDAASSGEEAFTGPESYSPAGRAEPGSDAFHRAFYPLDWQDLDEDWGALYRDAGSLELASPVLKGASQTYTYYEINRKNPLWKQYPHIWVGKFTFTTPSGDASCSATAISNNHIVTAAHCVYDTPARNAFWTNKAFTPAYRNGSAPYGTFATTGCTILTAYQNLSGSYTINGWARYDVAVCSVGKNSAGQTLNQAVGSAGRSWNFNYNQLHFNSGYPARNYNDKLLSGAAQYLRSCTAESFQQTTDTLGSGCYYGRGISGGPWLRDYKATYVSGYVNSVNSGLFFGTQNNYGARFTSNNIVVLCNASGC